MKEEYELKNIIIQRGSIEDAQRPFEVREVEKTELIQFVSPNIQEALYKSIEFSLEDGNIMFRALCKHTGDLKFIMGLCQEKGTKIGVPWMLTSKDFKPDIDFIRQSKDFISKDMYINGINVLCNYIHMGNKKSIKWLTWLGFKFTPHPYLDDYYQFYRYKE